MATTRPAIETHWTDDNPFCLYISAVNREVAVVDLGEHGWATTYAELMREPGVWMLTLKEGRFPVLVMQVWPGEQPYYTVKHVGVTGGGGSNEIKAYGIGKKQIDGTMMRLWSLPNGMVCGGEDVYHLGVSLVKAMGPIR